MESRGSPVPTFQTMTKLSLPEGGKVGRGRGGRVGEGGGEDRSSSNILRCDTKVCVAGEKQKREIPAVSSMLRAVGCHVTMPTRLE